MSFKIQILDTDMTYVPPPLSKPLPTIW